MRPVFVFLFLVIVNLLLPVGASSQIDSGFISGKGGIGCKVYTSSNKTQRWNEWSGRCVNGFGSGTGVLKVYENSDLLYTYKGPLVKGKFEGKGELLENNGNSYTGQFKNNVKEGRGTSIYHQGDIVTGEWKKGIAYNAKYLRKNDTSTLSFDIYRGERSALALFTLKDSSKYSMVLLTDSTISYEFEDALIKNKLSFPKLPVNEHSFKVDTNRLRLFQNPMVFYSGKEVTYYDAFYFSTTKPGNLFWSFDGFSDIASWFIITEKDNRYLSDQRSFEYPRFETSGLHLNGQSLQSSTLLQPYKDYIVWFSTDEEGRKKLLKDKRFFKVTLNVVDDETRENGVMRFFEGKRRKNLYFDRSCNVVTEKSNARFMVSGLYVNDTLSSTEPVTVYMYPSMQKISEGYYKSIYPTLLPMDGLLKQYFSNGRLKGTFTYKNGKMTGEYRNFHENGKVWEIGSTLNGEQHGAYKVYHDNGQLGETGVDEHGYRVGLVTQWDRYGNLIRERIVPPGTKSTDFKVWTSLGLCSY